MKISVLCCFTVAALVASLQYCSAERRNVNIGWNGVNHQSNNGRHNTNINVQNANYNYRRGSWRTNVQHNYWNGRSNLNVNYRKNHNIGFGHNSRNRQTNIEYKYNFGRKRRSMVTGQEVFDYVEIEREPSVFLEKLRLSVKQFVKSHSSAVPSLASLTVSSSTSGVISNVTVAREVVCLIKKLQRVMPMALGNFIIRMIKFHGPSFRIIDIGDFFTIKPIDSDEKEDENDEEDCVIPDIQIDERHSELDTNELFEIKKFVASLITVAMEYQHDLESEEKFI